MYRALYRKYRPGRFKDVVGQKAIVAALQNQILQDKVGHAYLFTGTRGTGKTSCAKIFAKAVNCENRHGAEPCGECVPCLGIEDGSILDVIEIDAASNNSVDDVRDLRDETAYRPSRGRYKVYIIDEVHMLSPSAFNALLKIMEEPPAHVIFILATTELHKVPATILSRCQRYDFTRIAPEDMAARLLDIAGEEEIALTHGAADLIARLADGALRDAVSLLDTCAGAGGEVNETLVRTMAGVADKGYLFAMSDALIKGEIAPLIGLVAQLRENSIDVKRLCEELVHHYRNLILAAAAPEGQLLSGVPEDDRQRYIETAQTVGEAFAVQAVRRLAAGLDKMGRAQDPRIELELALFDLAAPPTRVPMQSTVAVQQPAGQVTAPTAFAPGAALAPQQAQPSQAKPAVAEEAEEAETPQPLAALPAQERHVVEPQLPAIPAAPQANTQDGVMPFAPWPQVVERMADEDRMLYTYMKKSTAYTDGKRVLIDGGEMFLSYMRDYAEAADKIKVVIQDVTGARYGIGPYKGEKQAQDNEKPVTAKETLDYLASRGIPVKYD